MRRKLAICLGLYMLLLSVVSLLPGGEAAPLKWDSSITPTTQDIGHVPAYAILVLLALGLARASHRLSVARAVLIFAACCGVGALLEAGQWFIPGRTCSPSDALANVAGVAAGTVLWLAVSAVCPPVPREQNEVPVPGAHMRLAPKQEGQIR